MEPNKLIWWSCGDSRSSAISMKFNALSSKISVYISLCALQIVCPSILQAFKSANFPAYSAQYSFHPRSIDILPTSHLARIKATVQTHTKSPTLYSLQWQHPPSHLHCSPTKISTTCRKYIPLWSPKRFWTVILSVYFRPYPSFPLRSVNFAHTCIGVTR